MDLNNKLKEKVEQIEIKKRQQLVSWVQNEYGGRSLKRQRIIVEADQLLDKRYGA